MELVPFLNNFWHNIRSVISMFLDRIGKDSFADISAIPFEEFFNKIYAITLIFKILFLRIVTYSLADILGISSKELFYNKYKIFGCHQRQTFDFFGKNFNGVLEIKKIENFKIFLSNFHTCSIGFLKIFQG